MIKKIYKVFCASPGDVTAERDQLKSAITTWNNMNDDKHVELRFLGWEEDAISQFGVDPQQAINEQLGQEFDIFVMIVGKRIGSATPRAKSGTVEEFLAAVNRWQATGYPKIGMYFKDQAVNVLDESPEQIKGVIDLYQQVRSMGYVVRFKKGEFEAKIFRFLNEQVKILTRPVVS
jgi:hypothetical protein